MFLPPSLFPADSGFSHVIYCSNNIWPVNGLAQRFFVAIIIRMAKERGRPPKPDDERKAAELRIRLTEAERAELDGAAGGKTSTWARDVLLKTARRRKG